MKLATGTVIQGKVVFDGEALPDGTVVTVFGRDERETFDVPPELEQELDESLAQAARGETMSVSEALSRLRSL